MKCRRKLGFYFSLSSLLGRKWQDNWSKQNPNGSSNIRIHWNCGTYSTSTPYKHHIHAADRIVYKQLALCRLAMLINNYYYIQLNSLFLYAILFLFIPHSLGLLHFSFASTKFGTFFFAPFSTFLFVAYCIAVGLMVIFISCVTDDVIVIWIHTQTQKGKREYSYRCSLILRNVTPKSWYISSSATKQFQFAIDSFNHSFLPIPLRHYQQRKFQFLLRFWSCFEKKKRLKFRVIGKVRVCVCNPCVRGRTKVRWRKKSGRDRV